MKKSKYLILLVFVVVIAAASYFFLNKEEVLDVSTMKSYKGSITKNIEISGIVDSNDVEIIPIEPNWEVIKTNVKENDFVEENQLLVEFDTRDIDLSIQKARINLEDLNAELNTLSNDESTKIVLSNALEKSKEEYLMAQSDLKTANDDLEKAKKLYEAGAVSKSELDNHITQVNKLANSLKKAELALNDATVNYNKNEVDRKEKIASLQREIEKAKLDIETLNNNFKDAKIYSSTTGFLTEFPLDESEKTLSGQRITIYGADSYEFKAQVNQEDAALIKEGMDAIVTIDGLNKEYKGSVNYISKVATVEDGGTEPKVEIKIQISNPDDSIVFGYEGKANVILDKQDNLVIVKNESVKKEDDKEFVFVVEENITKKVFVETGISNGYLINIVNGIKENAVVVLNPSIDLVEGMTVKIVE